MVALTINHHNINPQGAETAIDIRGTKGLHHLPWIVGLRVTGAHYQWVFFNVIQVWSQNSQWGRWHQEDGAHIKINLPVFKNEDAKDTVTYQSWRWDLTVYQQVGCRDCTLLPYAIWSLQGYPGKLVWSSGTDITLDDVLTILNEHYNNVKALDALNQELFQLWMVDKETVLDWSVCLLRHLKVLAAPFPNCFPPFE